MKAPKQPFKCNLFKEIMHLCQRFSIHTLYLFGSRVKDVEAWIAAPENKFQILSSDIDIGIRLLPYAQIDVRDKVILTQSLEKLFQDQQVDLVLLNEADPFLAVNVIRGMRLYTVDEYAADEYELYILRRAADLAPFERARQALILGVSS